MSILGGVITGLGMELYGAITGDTRVIEAGQLVRQTSEIGGAGLIEASGKTNPITGRKGLEVKVPDSEITTKSKSASNVQLNKAKGDAFEAEQLSKVRNQYPEVQPQITVKTKSGVKTKLDAVVPEGKSSAKLIEYKSSAKAPLTKNQAKAFPEIKKSGATVVGKGKPGIPGGTAIKPTQVQVVRPN